MIPLQTPEDFSPKIPNILPRRNSSAPTGRGYKRIIGILWEPAG
jgi:hypothetical protein